MDVACSVAPVADHRFRPAWTAAEPPSTDVVDLLAPWIVDASRPFADWYFGEPDVAAEILTEWMVRPSSEVYLGRAIVAEDDEGVIGGCIIPLTGAELARCRAADFGAFCEELATEPEADAVIAEVVQAAQELFPVVADDAVYISRVGVDERRRGHGIGRALVSHVMSEYRRRGAISCRLDVSADNAAAIKAYEAAGLSVAATSHSPTAGLSYCAMTAPLTSTDPR
jgi:ribosomal protein S18 acetylase RimI-like enzyme